MVQVVRGIAAFLSESLLERRVWAAVRLSAGGPSALAVPTAALGADALVAEAFAAGFLPHVIPS